MGILIDASVIIDAERGRIDLEQRAASRSEAFLLSVVTASEILHGVHRAVPPDLRAKRSAFVEYVIAQYPALDIDIAVARVHAQLSADLASKGIGIGVNDLWIAATCLTYGHSIATANLRDFTRVPGLSVEHWPPNPY